MSPIGRSRHIAVPGDLGRFRGEADINGRVGPAGPVAIDPEPTCPVRRYDRWRKGISISRSSYTMAASM
jgi:hypothetical protein